MKYPKCSHSFEIISDLPESLRPLRRIAYNMRWSWDHSSQELFKQIDKNLFEQVEHNPVQLLAQLDKDRLAKLSQDEVFVDHVNRCDRDLDVYLTEPKWFQKTHPEKGDALYAYFCAEFGVSEALPIYSGGLGVLAGDHLKAASDLGLPLVAVGLLYSRGYFRQYLTPDGWQQEHYPQYDFYQMPLTLERNEDSQPLTVQVEFPDRTVTCQIWRADVGRVPLYLLDSNVLENEPVDQGITDTLYGGDEEMRIRQEMILGIGGFKALKTLGLSPSVCHMNEGHAAFLSIERIRQFMHDRGTDFRTARQVTVNGNVFTTHTPVPAGFDLFTPELFRRYLGHYSDDLAVSYPDILKMGRVNQGEGESFNMAILAMENANHVNGVSKLHAAVSREMFHNRWPSYPEDEVPIDAVTNGIHTPTWISHRMANLFDRYLGDGWRNDPANPESWKKVYDIPDAELWTLRENQRGDFVRWCRRYLQENAAKRGMGKGTFGQLESILDPRILTFGFARRFATYKRATLMLTDKERLKGLLFHKERPIQIVLAGKSHPRDDGGKKLIQDLMGFINHEGARARMVFLEDYDMNVARMLVQGVDIWLNNPRRPLEASGTSGMKVVPNGGLNCSILDGWWDEGFDPEVGWAIGDRTLTNDHGQQDWFDSRTLYHLIENEIAPTFYHRIDGNVPASWVEMMKHSIARLAPQFGTHRMVMDYAMNSYEPAHEAFRRIENDLGAAGSALIWRDRLQAAWDKVRIVHVSDNASASNPLSHSLEIKATVDLDGLSPEEVKVQAVLGQMGSNRDLINGKVFDMTHVTGEGSNHEYQLMHQCNLPGNRGYTVRVIPCHAVVNVKHELPLVRWES